MTFQVSALQISEDYFSLDNETQKLVFDTVYSHLIKNTEDIG